MIAQVAVKFGFADPRDIDFDSTVQEANIAYPSDASLMSKLTGIGKKVIEYLKKKRRHLGINFFSRFDKNQKDRKEIFFLTKEQVNRNKEGNIQGSTQECQSTNKTSSESVQLFIGFSNTKTPLEYKAINKAIKERCLEIFTRCWSFCSHPHSQDRENREGLLKMSNHVIKEDRYCATRSFGR